DQRYRLWTSPKSPEKYLVGEAGWKILEELIGGGDADATVLPGRSLEGLQARNPLNTNVAQGILADFVSDKEGTGVVHIAPGHGEDDYVAGKKYGLPVLSPVDEAGRFTKEVLPNDLAGKSVWESNAIIIKKLSDARLLLKEE